MQIVILSAASLCTFCHFVRNVKHDGCVGGKDFNYHCFVANLDGELKAGVRRELVRLTDGEDARSHNNDDDGGFVYVVRTEGRAEMTSVMVWLSPIHRVSSKCLLSVKHNLLPRYMIKNIRTIITAQCCCKHL